MNTKKMFTTFLFVLVATVLSASTGISETRRQMQKLSQDHIEQEFRQTVMINDLGDWRDAIENSLYIAIRKTDITRGTVTVRIANTSDFVFFMDCSGIFVISTGVLDFIDDTLFSLIGSSSRRIKNMTQERENLLIPLTVIAAARYTLDYQHSNYMASMLSGNSVTKATPEFSEQQIFEADRFACILLTAVGYNKNRLLSLLEILEKASQVQNNAYDLRPYLRGSPTPSRRIAELTRVADSVETVSADITLAEANIRKGIGLKDSIDTLRAIQQIYPTALCLDRFITTGMHKLWVLAHPQQDGLHALYAVGTYEIQETIPKVSTIADSVYRETESFYRKLLEKQDDPYIASDFAFFLALSPNKTKRIEALETAQQAATGEFLDGTISRRANYASVLYMIGNKKEAATLLNAVLTPNGVQNVVTDTKNVASQNARLYAGYVGRRDDAEYNYAIMTAGKTATVTAPIIQNDAYQIPLRGVRITDTMDTLLMRWGKPDEILYDFYTELWIYPALNTRVTVSNGMVSRIEVSCPSPVSLPGEIRTGDRREDFERLNGLPTSRAYDYDIYSAADQRLYIEYLSGKIRSIILCK